MRASLLLSELPVDLLASQVELEILFTFYIGLLWVGENGPGISRKNVYENESCVDGSYSSTRGGRGKL